MSKTPKHVIFLGAGASASSGYPMADDLRREWLASADGLRVRFKRAMGLGLTVEPRQNWILEEFERWIEKYRVPLQLFREGGFGTIDEFCYLLRGTESKMASDLKFVLRFVFGIHSPEEQFTDSDYYPFIQKLFDPKKLSALRSDVVVMSFNYDPYLEWLLQRGLSIRAGALAGGVRGAPLDPRVEAAVLSGLGHGTEGVKAIREGDSFCLLKLHGSAAWPLPARNVTQYSLTPHVSFDQFFTGDLEKRLRALTAQFGESEVPIVFPWEIMADNGTMLAKNEFILRDPVYSDQVEGFRAGGRAATDPDTHEIFQAIWGRAREEVQVADRISFVGLSMHEYLMPGFKYLFSGRGGKIVLGGTDRNFDGGEPAPPRSVYARIVQMRDGTCPSMGWNAPDFRQDFAEFIQKDV